MPSFKCCFKWYLNYLRENFDDSCQGFDCTVDYVHTYSCVYYYKNPADLDCQIPCFLANCTKTIMHRWTECPVWTCKTPYSPITPSLPLNHPFTVATIVLTILGTIMVTILCILCGRWLKKIYVRRHHHSIVSASERARTNPIYGKQL